MFASFWQVLSAVFLISACTKLIYKLIKEERSAGSLERQRQLLLVAQAAEASEHAAAGATALELETRARAPSRGEGAARAAHGPASSGSSSQSRANRHRARGRNEQRRPGKQVGRHQQQQRDQYKRASFVALVGAYLLVEPARAFGSLLGHSLKLVIRLLDAIGEVEPESAAEEQQQPAPPSGQEHGVQESWNGHQSDPDKCQDDQSDDQTSDQELVEGELDTEPAEPDSSDESLGGQSDTESQSEFIQATGARQHPPANHNYHNNTTALIPRQSTSERSKRSARDRGASSSFRRPASRAHAASRQTSASGSHWRRPGSFVSERLPGSIYFHRRYSSRRSLSEALLDDLDWSAAIQTGGRVAGGATT